MTKLVTRRRVVTAYSAYLNWANWFSRAKRGVEALPESETLASMAEKMNALKISYQELERLYIERGE